MGRIETADTKNNVMNINKNLDADSISLPNDSNHKKNKIDKDDSQSSIITFFCGGSFFSGGDISSNSSGSGGFDGCSSS